MRSLFPSSQAFRIAFALIFSFLLIQSVEAIVYPSTTPPGEVAGGTYRTYFDNMFFAPCTSGQTIRGFSSSGVPNCISGGAALSISGALGYTLYHDGMDWVSSPNIFNTGGNVGIGTSVPGAKLDVNGDAKINGITVGRGGGNKPENIAIGPSALFSNTFGAYNIAIGPSALFSNTAGNFNTANGASALSNNTTGIFNVANGYIALYSNTTGNFNTANGARALFFNTTGISNVANGHMALYSNTAGNYNTANGQQALYSNTTGISNVANGASALSNNTTGNYNTANGHEALYFNTTGNYNTALGQSAGTGLTTGSYNIALGYNTPFPSNTASNQLNIGNWIYGSGGNIGIGTGSSLFAKLTVAGDAKINGLTVGRGGGNDISNTVFGDAAFLSNTGGLRNVAIGQQAMTSGNNYDSIAIGDFALAYARNTMNNITIGSMANYGASSGDNNIAIGAYSLFSNNTGAQNVAVGTEALYNLGFLGSSSNNNTALGYHAGYPSATPSSRLGNSNTFLGANTLYPASSLGPIITNATAVGANTSVRQSNTVILGNGADVGIGTSTPGAKLEVAGQVKITGGTPGAGKVLTSDASGLATWTNTVSGATATGIIGGTQNYVAKFGTGGNGLYASQIFDNGSNVGIGTGTATKKLTVDSGIGNDSGLRLARISSTSTAYTGAAMGLGVDANGNIIPISNGDVVVYDGINRATPPTPDPNVAGRQISYDFNNFFDIPTKQSFVVSDGSSASRNGPYFKENGSSALCSWNGTYGSSAYDCATADPVTGLSASPHNSFTMTAKGTTFGYQIALGARGDAPLFARSGRFNGAVGGGLYTNDSPYQTPAPWQKVLTVPANHPEYLYVNTGLNSQLQTQTGGGNVGIGTTFPNSRFEVWTGATTSPLLHFRGANNVAMGLGAMNVAVSGNANSAFGAETLYSITTGYSNAAIGYRSLRTNAGGYNNVALGQESLYSNNGGSWNSSIGYQSLYSNSSGTGNIAFGPQALYNLSTGNNNIAIGYQAARVIAGSSVSRNIAIGYQSLYSATTSDLVAMGHRSLYANSSGVRNTAIGYQTLDAVTTGSGNTAVGYDTLGQTTGSNNTAYGNGAGNAITTGSNNIAIGSNAQVVVATGSNQLNIGNWIYGNGGNIGIGTAANITKKLTVNGDVLINLITVGKGPGTASNNTVVGSLALNSVTTGGYNTAIGTSALYSNVDGTDNVAVGYHTLYANISGYQNFALGSNALANNDGDSNIAIGYLGLYNNTSGFANVAIGERAGSNNTTGNHNVSIGYMAGTVSTGTTSGTNNIFIGYQTYLPSANASNQLNIGNWIYGNGGNIGIGTGSNLFAKLTVAGDSLINGITVGRGGGDNSKNTVFGYSALLSNTTGYFNTAIGLQALENNSTGSKNTAIGFFALNNNTTGYFNTAIGDQALKNNTTAHRNTAIGSMALNVNTTGYNNTAIGQAASSRNTTGYDNTAIGAGALNNNTTGSGNTAIGSRALEDNPTGDYNTALGYYAGSGLTTGSGNIALGYNTVFPSSTASNQLNIGNWIYGNGGNIGIGTSSSLTAKLTVAGTVKLGTNGSTLNSIIKVANAIDVPSVAAGACTAQTTTVTNAIVGGVVSVSPASALTDRMVISYARVSAVNTVEVKFCNVSAAAIDLPSMTYYVSVIQ